MLEDLCDHDGLVNRLTAHGSGSTSISLSREP